MIPDSHTTIQIKKGEPKVKAVYGEIIDFPEDFDKARLFMAGFRLVDPNNEESVLPAMNDAALAENAAKAEQEEADRKKALEDSENAAAVATGDTTVPEVVVPGGDVVDTPPVVPTDVPPATDTPSTDGSEGTNIGAESNGNAPVVPVDYTKMKQPELKEELAKRGLDVPPGVVSNASLIETLVADDAAKAEQPK